MPKAEQGVAVSLTRNRHLAIPRTLCFITRGHDEVLLLRGAPTKRIWAGKYNGVGGHVERGEDVFTSAVREIGEETGLLVENVRLRGVTHVDAGEEAGILVFVFSAEHRSGEPSPSPEGALEWVRRDQIGNLPLVEDLPAILDRIFEAAPDTPPFSARTYYDAGDRLVIEFANG